MWHLISFGLFWNMSGNGRFGISNLVFSVIIIFFSRPCLVNFELFSVPFQGSVPSGLIFIFNTWSFYSFDASV